MNVKIVAHINEDGSISPVLNEEQEKELFEDMPWLSSEDFEDVPASQLVIEIE